MLKRDVSVHQVPSEISSRSQMECLRRLELSVEHGHHRFVLDCSKLEQIGSSEILFLLCCLEEVMKHNGDIRLSSLHPRVQAALGYTGIGRLFEVYETIESAIDSYQPSPASIGASSFAMVGLEQETEMPHQDIQ